MSAEASGHRHLHVLPLKVYLGVGAALLFLTFVTVAVSFVHLGGVGNLLVAMLVATIKGSLVCLFFMHLLYDNKLYMITFISGLLFLAIFIIWTMFDTLNRERIYPYRAAHIQVESPFYSELRAHPPAAHDAHGGESHAEGHDSSAPEAHGNGPAPAEEHSAPAGH